MSRRLEAHRRRQELGHRERHPQDPEPRYSATRYINAEWLWEKFIPSLCEAISAPDGLWRAMLAPILSNIDLDTIHPRSAPVNEFLEHDCGKEVHDSLIPFAYLELKHAYHEDINEIVSGFGQMWLRSNRSQSSFDPERSRHEKPSHLDVTSDTEKVDDDTKAGRNKRRKGDASLLGDKRLITSRMAEAYLGITERQRQKLIKGGVLKVEGQGHNRRITAESLKAYLPPEIPN